MSKVTRYLLFGALLCIAVWLTWGGFSYRPTTLSQTEKEQQIASAQPVIVAIRAYQKDHGNPPAKLTDLVPYYLPYLPQLSHSLCVGHDYLYAVEPSQWRLAIPVQGGRDAILTYSSRGDYPTGKPGIIVERIGAWAYYSGNPY